MKRKINRIAAGILAVLMALTMLPVSAFAAESTVVISTADEFLAFAEAVNGGDTYKEKTVKLAADINIGVRIPSWTPIGPFDGAFDGAGHVISGLYINGTESKQALFAVVDSGAVIKNLMVQGEITSSGGYLAGIAAENKGTIENCASDVRITATGGNFVHYCGGIAADNSGAVTGCCFTGTIVKDGGSAIGGLVGRNFGGTVADCYNTGSVSSPAGSHVGGVIGQNRGSAAAHNLYNVGKITGETNVGAVIGQDKSASGTDKLYYLSDSAEYGVGSTKDTTGCLSGDEMKNGVLLSELGSAFKADEDGINGGYPVLAWEEKTENVTDLANLIRAAVSSAKTHHGAGSGTLLGSDTFLSGVSSTGTDWMALAMARFGCYDGHGEYQYLIDDGSGYDDYLAALRSYIEKTYAEMGGRLHSVKATEWHRAVLTILALGGDPTRFGTYDGKPIDLIADGSYNCVVSGGPGRQGINGWIFGLITMDAGLFAIPEDARYSREDFITEILKLQLMDGVDGNTYGGWVLSGAYGAKSDIDITAMVIQALAPYYSDSKVYTYTNTGSREQRSVTVRQCVNEALAVMSSRMDRNGGFSSWGSVNIEGVAQALVALCSLGIDPASDARFVTSGGKTLLDGMMQFCLPGGGFCHILGTDWNAMATDQGTYALVAYWRLKNGMRALYDMRGDFTDGQREAIEAAEAAIDRLPDPFSGNYKAKIKEALAAIRAVPADERRYVKNYASLAAALDLVGGEEKLESGEPYAVEIRVTKQPDKLRYYEGELFDPRGMEVTATLSDGTKQAVSSYQCAPSSALKPDDRTITIVYGGLKTAVSITVEEKLPWKGSGTAQDPWLIETAEDLAALAERVNRGENFADRTVALTGDLDLSGRVWTPIGMSETLAFAGTFDGQGFCIENLYSSKGGLFGYAADSAVIRDVGVASGEIGKEAGYGGSFFGGILNYSNGADVIRCWNGADIFCNGDGYSGGVVGTVRDGESVISGCFNRGRVTGSENGTRLGGIVGHLGTVDTGADDFVTIEDCYNVGAIAGGDSVGGIVGGMQDGPHTIARCYNAGTVEWLTPNPNISNMAGAIVGESTKRENTVRDCYYLAGSCKEGGLGKGVEIEDITVSLSETQMKDGTLLAALGDAFKADPYGQVCGGYPILTWQKTGEAGSADKQEALGKADAADKQDVSEKADAGPQTGDRTQFAGWVAGMLASGLAIIVFCMFGKMRRRRFPWEG